MDLVLSYRGSKQKPTRPPPSRRRRPPRDHGRGRRRRSPRTAAPSSRTRWRRSAASTSLVNMASIYRSKPLDDVTGRDWDADIDVNLRSAFLCAHAALPHMRASGGGRIVNFADWLARSGRPALHRASRPTTSPRPASSRSPKRWRSKVAQRQHPRQCDRARARSSRRPT